MKDAVPFPAPAKFAELGIDWTRTARTEPERSLREAFLTYEVSCGPNGLVSVLLLALVSRRQGSQRNGDHRARPRHRSDLAGQQEPRPQ